MCFNTDYDWCAMHTEDAEGPAPHATVCCECGKTIHKGEWRRWLYMQEREDGDYCQPDQGEHVEGCDGDDCEHIGPGETWEGDTCLRCFTLRDAIRQAEEADGCHGGEAEPSLGSMFDEVGDGYGWDHYLDEFIRLGLWEAVPLVPDIDWDDYLDDLAYDGRQHWIYAKPSGPYAGAVCELTCGDPSDWFDIGGEG